MVPILIDRATMPGEADLPPTLGRLAYRHALNLDSGPDFDHQVDRLIRGIERLFQQPEPATVAPPRQPEKPAETDLVPPPKTKSSGADGLKSEVQTKPGGATGSKAVLRPTQADPHTHGDAVASPLPGTPPTRRSGLGARVYLAVLPLLAVLGMVIYIVTETATVKISGKDPIKPNESGSNGIAVPTGPTAVGEPKIVTSRAKVEPPKAAPPLPRSESPSLQPMKEFTNSIGMKLTLIPAGEFLMGSDESDKDAYDDEFLDKVAGKTQKHRVRITRPFYLGVTEVTRGQFRRFVNEAGYRTYAEKDNKGGHGWNEETKEFEQNRKFTWRNVGFEQTDDHPVVNVSWSDAQAFVSWLSRREGKGYRLPTEAEWEYACRAGTTTRYFFGDDPESLAAFGNIADATAKETYPEWTTIAARDGYVYTAPVGRYRPNAWGLFDMHGNVWEWCSDRYAADYYKRSPVDNPPGTEETANRVFRGGSWIGFSRLARSAYRGGLAPGFLGSIRLGFRLALEESGR